MRLRLLTVTAVLLLAAAFPAAATVDFGGAPAASDDATGGNASAPGARLSGVVGVEGAELEGDVAVRAFDARLERADSPAGKAAVVSDTLGTVREQIVALQQRRERLREARDNGSISDAEYRARIATLAGEASATSERLNATAETADELPDEALTARGVNRSEVDHLRTEARNLTGPEVAAIARSVTGQASPPGDRARGDAAKGEMRAESAIRAAETRVDVARHRVEAAPDDANVSAAQAKLDDATAALDSARDAFDDGDYQTARTKAEDARELANEAIAALPTGGEKPGDAPGGDTTPGTDASPTDGNPSSGAGTAPTDDETTTTADGTDSRNDGNPPRLMMT